MSGLILVQQEIIREQHEHLSESESIIKKLRAKCKAAGCCANIACTNHSLYPISYTFSKYCWNCKISYCQDCYAKFGKLICELCTVKFGKSSYDRHWLCLDCCQNYDTCPDCRERP